MEPSERTVDALTRESEEWRALVDELTDCDELGGRPRPAYANYCFFCGAEPLQNRAPDGSPLPDAHAPDCPWVKARQRLGKLVTPPEAVA